MTDARICSIRLYDVSANAYGTGQKLSAGRVFKHFQSCIVAVETADGTVGWGETMPYSSNYLPAFAAGARAALAELAPALIGCDVRSISVLQTRMDHALYGHGYAKVGIEMAAWDALGKLSGWPLYQHFGGLLSPEPQISAHIGTMADEDRADRMFRYRSLGIRQFACKATGDVVEDIAYVRWLSETLAPGESAKLDANGAWRVDEGIRVLRAAQDIPLWFEQPCQTYEECRDLRRAVAMPVILDECADSLSLLIRAYEDRVLDAVSLKPAKNGGIAHTLAMRDFLTYLGKPMHVQDAGGTDIVNAMIAHIAHSVAPRRLLYVWDAHNLIETVTATGGPDGHHGRLCASDRPGLGVAPIPEVLGQPYASFH